jgi:hypothetical protein
MEVAARPALLALLLLLAERAQRELVAAVKVAAVVVVPRLTEPLILIKAALADFLAVAAAVVVRPL